MNKYKTFEELKEELGNKFEEYMYKANIELLNKIDKAIELLEKYNFIYNNFFREGIKTKTNIDKALNILKGSEK